MNLNISILIVEDEVLAARNLEQLIHDLDPSIKVLNIVGTIRETVQWLNNNSVDLIFLDIQLSDGLSFKIFEQIEVKTPIIFTTAYDQFAIKAFDVNSVNYLLKPIKIVDLEKSLQKFKMFHVKENTIDYNRLVNSLKNQGSEYLGRFSIHVGDKIKVIEVDSVACFYVVEKSVFAFTKQKERYAVDFSLDELMEKLNPKYFFRINRQHIIHISAISQMNNLSNRTIKIELTPTFDQETIVSLLRLSQFKKWINQ